MQRLLSLIQCNFINPHFPNNKCYICKDNCQGCLSESFCTKCSASFYIFNGKCYHSCSNLGDSFVGNKNLEYQCDVGVSLKRYVCDRILDGCDKFI